MTIDGAMQDDVDVLQKGIIHILPDDEHGRAVLFMDRTKMCEPHATTEQIVSVPRRCACAFSFILVGWPFSNLPLCSSDSIVSPSTRFNSCQKGDLFKSSDGCPAPIVR
jgi:hypothetical protein